MTRLDALTAAMRAEATRFAELGALVDGAKVLTAWAVRVEQAVRDDAAEALTLDQAAQEAGVSYTTMQRRVARGAIPNIGRPGAPRVRRCDLPGRPAGPDLVGAVLAEYRTGGGG